jgi:hypothetical protein
MAYEYEGNMVNELPVNECEDELSTLSARVVMLEALLLEALGSIQAETSIKLRDKIRAALAAEDKHQ